MLTSQDFTIIPYRSQALSAVRELHAISFSALASQAHSPAQIAAHTQLTRTAAYGLDLETSNMLLACFAGQVVATAGWCLVPGHDDTARVRKVFVHPELAGAGVGRRMVQAVEHAARDRGLRRFTVRANINARGFYERMGYLPTAPGTMPACGVELPVMYMKKG